MYNTVNRSPIFVLDQDEARHFYVDVLGFMRWLTVRVPGDQSREILLEQPGPPAMDEATALQVRELVTKGAMGGWLCLTTDDAQGVFETLEARGSTSRTNRRQSRTALTSESGIRSVTPFGSVRCSKE